LRSIRTKHSLGTTVARLTIVMGVTLVGVVLGAALGAGAVLVLGVVDPDLWKAPRAWPG
jgi:hypothetical protein